MLQFENPYAFLFFLTIPLFFIFRKFGLLVKISFPVTLSDWEGKSFVWNSPLMKIAKVFSRLLFIAGFVALVLSLASPVILKQEKVYTSKGNEIVFVVDISPSMAARDIADGTRLDAAKNTITQMVENMEGTSFGLIALASEAASIVAPTIDYEFFKKSLASLQIGDMGEGTAIGTGLSTAIFHLANSKAQKKSIILLTDGENNAGVIHPNSAVELAVEKNIKIYTIGIGTRGTVSLEYTDAKTGKRYSGYLESEFNDVLLSEIAVETGGIYFPSENILALIEALNVTAKKEKVVQSFYYRNTKKEFYDILLKISILCFLLTYIFRRIFMKEV